MTFNTDHALETFKSLISISVEVLRSLLLLNGGAVVALLAYLGQAKNGADIAKHATCPLSWFIGGLLLSLLAFIGSYLTQLALYQESVHKKDYSGAPHTRWLRLSIIAGLLSLVAFAAGSFSAVSVLSNGAQP